MEATNFLLFTIFDHMLPITGKRLEKPFTRSFCYSDKFKLFGEAIRMGKNSHMESLAQPSRVINSDMSDSSIKRVGLTPPTFSRVSKKI